ICDDEYRFMYIFVGDPGMRESAASKTAFNRTHSQTRMTIEHAFGILTACWRFLSKEIYILDYKDIVQVVTTACILHNICIYMADTYIVKNIEERRIREARQAMRIEKDGDDVVVPIDVGERNNFIAVRRRRD
ncbi:hypothetical protein CU098_001709, partial [Rhizopus stolonifer]